MKLIVSPLSHSKAIKLTLSNGHRQWEAVAELGEDLVATLDKILKNAKIDFTSIKTIHVLPQPKASLTSLRLAKTVQQALKIANVINPRAL